MKYFFKDINESASVEKLEGAKELFRLRYTNNFYGNCSVRLHLTRMTDGQIHADSASMQIESSEVKKGDLNSLLNVAFRFLTRRLAQHPEILAGQSTHPQTGWLARIRNWFGFGQPQQKPAVYEKSRSNLGKAGTR